MRSLSEVVKILLVQKSLERLSNAGMYQFRQCCKVVQGWKAEDVVWKPIKFIFIKVSVLRKDVEEDNRVPESSDRSWIRVLG